MAVVIETTLGDITVELFNEERPHTCLNFLKLCKIKYYNFGLFHSVQHNFIAQTGDPTGSGKGGESVYGKIYGEQSKYYEAEMMPKIKHTKAGLLSMVNCGNNMLGSQFFITLGAELQSLDGEHCVFGEVAEGEDVLLKLNEALCDTEHRPYQDIRITHTVILEDPFDDPPGLVVPDTSPEPSHEALMNGRIGADEEIDETKGRTEAEVEEMQQSREAKAQATILEIVGDLPDAEMAPPENVLFVCKLNPVTTDDDLEIIFSRFGVIKSCEVIRDKNTGDSLQYAFVEFENRKTCEEAYFKMDNVLIDDRRIHVDFSQSVSKLRWKGKGRGVEHMDEKSDWKSNGHRNHHLSSRPHSHSPHDERSRKRMEASDGWAIEDTASLHDSRNAHHRKREEFGGERRDRKPESTERDRRSDRSESWREKGRKDDRSYRRREDDYERNKNLSRGEYHRRDRRADNGDQDRGRVDGIYKREYRQSDKSRLSRGEETERDKKSRYNDRKSKEEKRDDKRLEKSKDTSSNNIEDDGIHHKDKHLHKCKDTVEYMEKQGGKDVSLKMQDDLEKEEKRDESSISERKNVTSPEERIRLRTSYESDNERIDGKNSDKYNKDIQKINMGDDMSRMNLKGGEEDSADDSKHIKADKKYTDKYKKDEVNDLRKKSEDVLESKTPEKYKDRRDNKNPNVGSKSHDLFTKPKHHLNECKLNSNVKEQSKFEEKKSPVRDKKRRSAEVHEKRKEKHCKQDSLMQPKKKKRKKYESWSSSTSTSSESTSDSSTSSSESDSSQDNRRMKRKKASKRPVVLAKKVKKKNRNLKVSKKKAHRKRDVKTESSSDSSSDSDVQLRKRIKLQKRRKRKMSLSDESTSAWENKKKKESKKKKMLKWKRKCSSTEESDSESSDSSDSSMELRKSLKKLRKKELDKKIKKLKKQTKSNHVKKKYRKGVSANSSSDEYSTKEKISSKGAAFVSNKKSKVNLRHNASDSSDCS